MAKASREFQVFVKPTGSVCNLGCRYCYYLGKGQSFSAGGSACMPEQILETYIVQHLEAFPGPVVNFSWHGGEPTLLGTGFFSQGGSPAAQALPPRPPDHQRHSDQRDAFG